MRLMGNMTLIRRPVFVYGFSRGGTNLLMNLLLSSPDLAMPSGELQYVIGGGALGSGFWEKLRKRVSYQWPFGLLLGPQYFNRLSFQARQSMPFAPSHWFDMMLWLEKAIATQPGHNYWFSPGVRSSFRQRIDARLVVKAHDGYVFLHDAFVSLYPDCKAVAIVRNGLALAESLLRRGWSLNFVIDYYTKIGGEIARLAQDGRLTIMKYESLISNVFDCMNDLDRHLDLNLSNLSFYRMQYKARMGADGNHGLPLGVRDRDLVWYSRSELSSHFVQNANSFQVSRLDGGTRSLLTDRFRDIHASLGYL
jgi:hypothetical protein